MAKHLKTKVAIIGAGPAGMVSAAWLLKHHIQPVVIEKQQFPRLIVGESLLPKSMEHFEETDLIEPIKAAGFEVKPGARFIRGDSVFNLNFSEQFTSDCWKWTWQVPRAEFDQLLADEIQSRGAEIHFGSKITDIDFDADNPVIEFVKENKKHVLEADFIIDSSGFGSVIPTMLNQDIKREPYPKSAVFTHVYDTNKSGFDRPQLISFDILDLDLWLWVIPFSNGVTSLGFVGGNKQFKSDPADNEAYFRELLQRSAIFRDRFKDAEMLFDPLWMKGYSQSVDQLYGKQYVLTGNCVEFLDPIFSSGVAFATESGLTAAKLLVKQLNGEKSDWEKDYAQHMKKGIDVFRTYVEGWYNGDLQDVFFSGMNNQEFKDQICSILAGYVWDQQNPFVSKHKRALKALAKVIRMNKQNEF